MQSLGKVFTKHGFPFAGFPRRPTLKRKFTRSRFIGSSVGRNTCEKVRPVQKLGCEAVATQVSVHPWAPGSRYVLQARIDAKGPGF